MVAVLVDLAPDRDPRRMELCADHAISMTVPRGWTRVDERHLDEADVPEGPPSVAEIASLSTLDVIAAALAPSDVDDVDDVDPDADATDLEDGPSVAAVMAAALANPSVQDSQPADDVAPTRPVEVADDAVTGGAQLSLAPDVPSPRRPRPVPASLDDSTAQAARPSRD